MMKAETKGILRDVGLGVVIGAAVFALLIMIWGARYDVQTEGKNEAGKEKPTVQKGAEKSNGQSEELSGRIGTDSEAAGQLQSGLGIGKADSEGLQTGSGQATGKDQNGSQDGLQTGPTDGVISRGTDYRDMDSLTYDWDAAETYVVSAYSLGPGETGKAPGDPDYGRTASGAMVQEGVTIAADWNKLPPGTVVYIERVGLRVVQDKGGGVHGNHIDLYIADPEKVRAWGVPRLKVIVIQIPPQE